VTTGPNKGCVGDAENGCPAVETDFVTPQPMVECDGWPNPVSKAKRQVVEGT